MPATCYWGLYGMLKFYGSILPLWVSILVGCKILSSAAAFVTYNRDLCVILSIFSISQEPIP